MTRADEGLGFLLRFENVAWYDAGEVRILDRRVYPIRVEYVTCRTHQEVARAITDMVTQSWGPYLAAAMGMALAAHEARDLREKALLTYLEQAAHTLSHARPTTVAQMGRTTDRAMAAARESVAAGRVGAELVEDLRAGAVRQVSDYYACYTAVARYLADMIPQNGTIMTQCFAEAIVGTLLRECRRRGNPIKVICPETRPYFQGARLTASVARDMDFDVTVITDNMPAYTLEKKHVDVFTSAADIITMDGHVINKVGTFQIALAAQYWGIPFFVTGLPDTGHPDMRSVVIEERDPELTLEARGVRTAMAGVKGYYPAFDVTPPKLCSGVVTDRGIFSPFDLKRYYAV